MTFLLCREERENKGRLLRKKLQVYIGLEWSLISGRFFISKLIHTKIIPIITALPFGSTARYCPGTILLQPLLPNVSWWTWKIKKKIKITLFHQRGQNLKINKKKKTTGFWKDSNTYVCGGLLLFKKLKKLSTVTNTMHIISPFGFDSQHCIINYLIAWYQFHASHT